MKKGISKVEFFNLDKELHKKHFRVAIFGSARIKSNNKYYKEVENLARILGSHGIDVITGGGPGLMEAANIGHEEGKKKYKKNGTHSFGLTIRLPEEQHDNNHFDMKRDFKNFSKRLDTFAQLSNAVVVAPGGVGTLLEFLYVWQLVQVEHICDIPIILLGEQWRPLLEWVKKGPLKHKLLNMEDIESIFLAKNAKEASKIILEAHESFKKNSNHMCNSIEKYRSRI